MSENILVPVLGESITEATVSKWLKNEGDTVEADEPIVELETDKVNLEVPSPVSGVLTKINSKDGSVVEVGSLLGSVSGNGSETIKVEKEIKIKPTLEQNNIVKLETQKNEPEIFDEKEHFYKVGITSNSVTKRYNTKKLMPYDYEILMEAEIGMIDAYENESYLLQEYSKYKYIPKRKFNGKEECLSINPIEHDERLKEYSNYFRV